MTKEQLKKSIEKNLIQSTGTNQEKHEIMNEILCSAVSLLLPKITKKGDRIKVHHWSVKRTEKESVSVYSGAGVVFADFFVLADEKISIDESQREFVFRPGIHKTRMQFLEALMRVEI